MEEFDLFGNPIEKKYKLRDDFIEPPFTILDARSGEWQKRKNQWIRLGIKGEVGRDAACIHMDSGSYKDGDGSGVKYTSVFDPALCEIMYKWFCPSGGANSRPFCRRFGSRHRSQLHGLPIYRNRHTRGTSLGE